MKILLPLLFIFVFAFVAYGQSVPNKNGRELKSVEKQISSTKLQIKNTESEKAALSVKYDDSYPEILKLNARISELNKILASLEVKKKELLQTKLSEDLPNNSIELLKRIVLQNERIIELLEKLAPQN